MFCLIADLNSLNLVLINADIELIKSSFRGDLVPFFVYIDCPCFHWGGGGGGGRRIFKRLDTYSTDNNHHADNFSRFIVVIENFN